jgi:outer membrane protein assembly factor BamD (BamD/ComL family)
MCLLQYILLGKKRIIKKQSESGKKTDAETVPETAKAAYTKTIEKCSKVIAYYPESRWVEDALFLLGMSLLWTDEPVKAATKFEELLAAFPNTKYEKTARYWRSYAYMKAGDFEKAESEFTLLAEEGKGEFSEQAAFMIGQGFFEKEDFVQAEISFESFTEKFPKSKLASLAYVRLMSINERYEKYESVVNLSEKVRKSDLGDKDWFNAQMMKGTALINLGRLDQALEHLLL